MSQKKECEKCSMYSMCGLYRDLVYVLGKSSNFEYWIEKEVYDDVGDMAGDCGDLQKYRTYELVNKYAELCPKYIRKQVKEGAI